MGLLAYLKTQFAVHLLIGFVFVVSGLAINFMQLCTLVLWPINKQLYRRLNCRLAYSLWSQLAVTSSASRDQARNVPRAEPPRPHRPPADGEPPCRLTEWERKEPNSTWDAPSLTPGSVQAPRCRVQSPPGDGHRGHCA